MPDTTLAIAIMLGSFVILLMMRMPISFTLGISSVLTALYLNIPLATLFQRMVNGAPSFSWPARSWARAASPAGSSPSQMPWWDGCGAAWPR